MPQTSALIGAEIGIKTIAAVHSRGQLRVKTRMPPEGSHVSFRQLRTSRPMGSIRPCVNNGPMRCSKTVSLFDHVVGARDIGVKAQPASRGARGEADVLERRQETDQCPQTFLCSSAGSVAATSKPLARK